MNNQSVIKTVQEFLHLPPPFDGIAGPKTWNAVCHALQVPVCITIDGCIRAAQARLNIGVDGIDGPQTWAAISRALGTGESEPLAAADQHVSKIQSPAYWQQLFVNKHGENDFVKLVAVRGWLEGTSKDNRFDIYDDVIVRIMGTQVDLFKAAVDPTSYLVRNPINTDGAAQLTTGVWLMQRGIHKGVAEHKCLVQAEDFVVNRLHRDGSFSHTDTGDFGIHNHPGGSDDETQRFSAGCQIIHMPDYYWGPYWFTTYFNPMSAAMDAHGQWHVAYNLVNAQDLP